MTGTSGHDVPFALRAIREPERLFLPRGANQPLGPAPARQEKALLARQIEQHVLPNVSAGRVHVPLAAACPLEQAADAYAHFADGGKTGKIVLTF